MKITTNRFGRSASVFALATMLASCSNNYGAFFEEKNAQLEKGYTWEKLAECRPPQPGSQAVTILSLSGELIVCYTLTPPSNQPTVVNKPLPHNTKTIANLSETQPAMADTAIEASGVIWQFSNF